MRFLEDTVWRFYRFLRLFVSDSMFITSATFELPPSGLRFPSELFDLIVDSNGFLSPEGIDFFLIKHDTKKPFVRSSPGRQRTSASASVQIATEGDKILKA